jgi:hypothetical protein
MAKNYPLFFVSFSPPHFWIAKEGAHLGDDGNALGYCEVPNLGIAGCHVRQIHGQQIGYSLGLLKTKLIK